MTTRTQRIEVITRGERRRRWPIEEKREIVAESLRPGSRPSEVIRKYGISSGQLYAWRQQLTRRLGGEVSGLSANFASVDVVVAQQQEKVGQMTEVAATAVARPPVAVPVIASPRAEGLIEIMLANGASLRVDAHVDARALRRVLGALDER
jgi:transposase